MINQIELTLTQNGCDFQQAIDDFGQVRAYEQRLAGKAFTLREHVRGLILSQLSNQRVWKPIADNMTAVERIFLDFDPAALKAANPQEIEQQLKRIKCGNRAIAKQLAALAGNIEIFETWAAQHGSMDAFITSAAPDVIATLVAKEIKQVGFTLACEYLRNVGINTVKPDTHICRMIGPERLGLVDMTPKPEEAFDALMAVAGDRALYVDTLLWIFAADGYGEICTVNPKCELCSVTACAKHPSR